MASPDRIAEVRTYYSGTSDSFEAWHPEFYHLGYYPDLRTIIKDVCATRRPLEVHRRSVETLAQKIIQFADIKEGDKVLDAGCGTGGMTRLIGRHGVETYGINVAAHQLHTALQYMLDECAPNVHFSVQDFARTSFPSNFFDRVIFVESLTHASNKKAVLQETARILTSQGELVIADAFQTSPIKGFSAKALKELEEGMKIDISWDSEFTSLLEQLGFDSVEVYDESQHVLPSMAIAALSSLNALLRDRIPNEVKKKNRRACIALFKLAIANKLQYHLVKAKSHD